MEEFITRLNVLKDLQIKKMKTSWQLGTVRLIVFIMGVVLTFLLIEKGLIKDYYFLIIIVILIFMYFASRHNSIINELSAIKCKIDINQKYLDRMDDKWVRFADGGEEFINSEHSYSSDLDIFGMKSLFKWINISNTFYGRKTLASFLGDPEKDVNNIKIRQSGVSELGSKLDFCQELQCVGRLSQGIEEDPKALIEYVENSSKIFKTKWIMNLFYIMPIITIVSAALVVFKYPIPKIIPIIMVVLQMMLMAIGSFITLPILNTVYKFKSSIEAYKNIILLIEKESFKDPYLAKLKMTFYEKNKSASSKIKTLERIVDAIDMRYNPFVYFALNITVLWDYHCVFALEEWKEKNGASISKWFESIGYVEAISCLSVMRHINPDQSFPTFVTSDLKFSSRDLGHPLIIGSKRVNNDFAVKNNLCIVTGSNMSGKTTLLRTIGINLVLAYAGAPVYASVLECSIMDIFTSMRIADDLNSGISTFYAELLRIKMIIEHSKKKLPMIFLVDELFRGTNSRDRVIGAKSMLKNLSKAWIIGLISTHDFELCELEHEANTSIANYHFTESYIDNKINFDYKLLPGRCQTTNAKYLMRMVGIELFE